MRATLRMTDSQYRNEMILRNGTRAACNHGVMDARGKLLSTKEAYRLVRLELLECLASLPSAFITPCRLHSWNVFHFFYNIIKREKHIFPFAFGWVIGPISCMLPSARPFEFFFRWINRSPSSGKLQNVVILNGICLLALNIRVKTLRENYSCNYKHQLKRLKNKLKLK